MVADPPALATVLEGPDGVFAGCRRGTLVVDMSTVEPGTSQAMAGKARALGLRYLEAPVTGGVGAAERERSPSWSGEAPRISRRQAAPGSMGKKVLHVGPMGRGSVIEALPQSGCGEHRHGDGRRAGACGEAGVDPTVAAEVLAERSPLIARGALGFLRESSPRIFR